MIRTIYKHLLKLPDFPGRHHIDELFRKLLEPSIDRLANGLADAA